MKQLFIIRHAKSSWAVSGQNDFDRPLNERGMKDAPLMAKRLLEANMKIEAFVSSPANRALTTATYFAWVYHQDPEKIMTYPKLYHAYPPVFYEVIVKLSDKFHSVALFAHNPGITDFVNELTYTRIDDMPTCGIFAVSADTAHWKGFKNAAKEFLFFDYPKN
ncbi:MAG: hypothetical protein RLZZ28_1320 [Bacteroidota bacterium]|jgi:phosphohistidine phosphatase